MTAEEQKNLRTFVEGIAVATITKPSQRDRQRAPGPSDLADKCDLCVARKIATSLGIGSNTERGFSLKAWIGTAIHEKLERDLPAVYAHAEQEITVEVADIPGIGLVRGHVDVFLPRQRAAVDWKTTDMKRLKGYKTQASPGAYIQGLTAQEREELAKLKALDRAAMLTEADMGRLVLLMARSEQHSGGVPQEYMGQTMLYLYGLRAMGRQADYAVLAFIPRDSNNVSDMWVASCKYRPDVAEGVINRAAHLAKLVRAGKIGELEAHPECFPCVIRPRLAR
ncbi:Cas4 family exonuclease [Streptomyces phage Satis]|nr:Cas4 family exonuclease [Streptomyces phage Satis]QBZ71970.1 Cas4 family exonuclease [Streptomyces phage Kradal]QPL14389.1 Cas4 family exonuclease [Streptomyces phage EhyElimayoE]